LAGEAFRSIGMGPIAEAEPISEEKLDAYAVSGRSWVATDELDQPVGYVIVDVVDKNAHVEQISVLPGFQGQGLGRELLDAVRLWAVESGRAAITLTTFTHVPWNRPLYEHLGFVVMSEEELGPELQAVQEHETQLGLDPTTRVCMRTTTSVSLIERA
jgi:GNAT superfamily N-acetyltransferase